MLVNPGEGANGSQIVRRDAQHGLEFHARLVKLPQFDQRATEGDLRGQIPWMPRQPVAADRDRLLVIASASVLLGELCKRDRRRVLLDPAAQRFDARVLIHTLWILWWRAIAIVGPHDRATNADRHAGAANDSDVFQDPTGS